MDRPEHDKPESEQPEPREQRPASTPPPVDEAEARAAANQERSTPSADSAPLDTDTRSREEAPAEALASAEPGEPAELASPQPPAEPPALESGTESTPSIEQAAATPEQQAPAAAESAPTEAQPEHEPEHEPDHEPEPAPPPEGLRQWIAVWRGGSPPSPEIPAAEVRAGNLVVQGTLTGIESYMLRAVPASTSGVAERLRARSFRVLALRSLFSRRVQERLGLHSLFESGTGFVLAGPAEHGWEEALAVLQREFDIWLFQHLQPPGELACLLSGAVGHDDRLPLDALRENRRHRAVQPHEGALRVGLRWNSRAFVAPAGPQIGRCVGCASITAVRLFGEETLCDACAHDTEAGERLPAEQHAWLCPEAESDVPGPALGLRFSESADLTCSAWPITEPLWKLHRVLPLREGRPIPLADLTGVAGGAQAAMPAPQRPQLGYARIRLDHPERHFGALAGDPARTGALARILEELFTARLLRLIEAHQPNLLPVWCAGHEALLLGPWPEVLDALLRLRRDAANSVGEGLKFSAGMEILPPAALLDQGFHAAAEALEMASAAGGDRFCALGAVVEWERARALLGQARTVAGWLKNRVISGGWLQRLVELRASSRNGSQHWRPLLHAAARDHRIKAGPARAWAARMAHSPESPDWKWIEFIARYASLTAVPARAAAPAEEPHLEPQPGPSSETLPEADVEQE